MGSLALDIEGDCATRTLTLTASSLVIAGWTGRDKAATEHHIAELEALGVQRPPQVPTYYRSAASRLTTRGEIEVIGSASSGEVEPVMIRHDGQLYVGVGSDHTDRKLETHGVALSKQICDKPIAATVWPYDDVAGHWDALVLRSYATIDGQRTLFQDGGTRALIHIQELMDGYRAGGLAEGAVMFGGTIPAIGGVRPASRFEGELYDPVLGRTIKFGYDIKVLPA